MSLGKRLINPSDAGGGGGDNIYVSSIQGTYVSYDLGGSFQQLNSNYSTDVTASSTGQYILIGLNSSNPRLSTDFGATFNLISSNVCKKGVAMSLSGQYMLGAQENGELYVSNNYGASFTGRYGNRAWNDVTVSGTGQYMYAAADGYVHMSSNYGVTWSQISFNRTSFTSISSNNIGSNFWVSAASDGAYKNVNYGANNAFFGITSGSYSSKIDGWGNYAFSIPNFNQTFIQRIDGFAPTTINTGYTYQSGIAINSAWQNGLNAGGVVALGADVNLHVSTDGYGTNFQTTSLSANVTNVFMNKRIL